MTRYNVPFEEKVIKVYVVEAADRLRAAVEAGKLRERGVAPDIEHPLSERLLTIAEAVPEQLSPEAKAKIKAKVEESLSTIERGPVNERISKADGQALVDEAARLVPPKHT
jgi:hypothetical protein